MPDFSVGQVCVGFTVLLASLTVHEMSHAWVADALGDKTARLLGRVSLNPMVHADLIGTVIFPKANLKDLEEIPSEIRAKMKLLPVERMDEVLARALVAPCRPNGRKAK